MPEEKLELEVEEVAPRKITPIMQYFDYAHLPNHLQMISKPVCDLARKYDDMLPNGPEKSAGLRKLLEAKDALVRASL